MTGDLFVLLTFINLYYDEWAVEKGWDKCEGFVLFFWIIVRLVCTVSYVFVSFSILSSARRVISGKLCCFMGICNFDISRILTAPVTFLSILQ